MRKLLLITACSALIGSCTNDTELNGGNNSESKQNTIGFEVLHRNSITTKAGKSNLQEAGHYNFGVFAYKNISSSSSQQVMNNYLVGYKGINVGYNLTDANQTTLSSSNWAYEKLGSSEYTYDGTDGYYKKDKTFYMSNNANQYLKYWDKSSESVDFYAYAPYINGNQTATFAPDTKKMTIGNDGIKDGYDDRSKHEFMYANTTVAKANYNKEVQLAFKRISAKMQIKFYEDIAGYKVQILDLKEDNTSGVCAAPAIAPTGEGTTYTYGTLYHSAGATIDFSSANPSLSLTGNTKFSRESTNGECLRFNVPTANSIGTDKNNASPSSTTYYLIPINQDNTGLTFHVTYKLTAEDTRETIIVRNATVHVPYSACNWTSNNSYTYIFKITKNSTGTTESNPTIDPSDPNPSTDKALYPIIFDECTIENWTEVDSEHNINDNN